jgi:hypothetical protein
MPYRCRLVEKTVQTDHHEDGADPNSSRIMMDGRDLKTFEGDSARKVIADAFGYLGLPTDYFFVNDEDSAEYNGCNRLEDDDADEPSRARMAAFERGEITLWLADYTFKVEYLERRPLSRDELSAAFPGATID